MILPDPNDPQQQQQNYAQALAQAPMPAQQQSTVSPLPPAASPNSPAPFGEVPPGMEQSDPRLQSPGAAAQAVLQQPGQGVNVAQGVDYKNSDMSPEDVQDQQNIDAANPNMATGGNNVAQTKQAYNNIQDSRQQRMFQAYQNGDMDTYQQLLGVQKPEVAQQLIGKANQLHSEVKAPDLVAAGHLAQVILKNPQMADVLVPQLNKILGKDLNTADPQALAHNLMAVSAAGQGLASKDPKTQFTSTDAQVLSRSNAVYKNLADMKQALNSKNVNIFKLMHAPSDYVLNPDEQNYMKAYSSLIDFTGNYRTGASVSDLQQDLYEKMGIRPGDSPAVINHVLDQYGQQFYDQAKYVNPNWTAPSYQGYSLDDNNQSNSADQSQPTPQQQEGQPVPQAQAANAGGAQPPPMPDKVAASPLGAPTASAGSPFDNLPNKK